MLASSDLLRVFAISRLAEPIVIEMFGLAGGYHGFWLDAEHVMMTPEKVGACGLAARAAGLNWFVRMPMEGYWQVARYLELGAGGVMAAQVRTVEEARQFTSWCKFPPAGVRGLNTGGVDAKYTYRTPAELVEFGDNNTFVAIQIETAEAAQCAEEIATVPGVDLLFIGPSDLSCTLGVTGQFHSDQLWQAIERVAAACDNTGKHWGCAVPDAAFAKRAVALGCRMPTLGGDIIAVRRGVETLQATFGDHF
jgi:2-keto-3-deoxy-L-rhamnonate aldolase RhmA